LKTSETNWTIERYKHSSFHRSHSLRMNHLRCTPRVKKCKFALSNPCILVLMYTLIRECIGNHGRQQAVRQGVLRHQSTFQCDVQYTTSKHKYNYDTSARNFAVLINGFMSLTSYFDEKYGY
jgi:hypothetical protein